MNASMTCDTPSWEESTTRAMGIFYTVTLPVLFGGAFWASRNVKNRLTWPCGPIKNTWLWLFLSLCESIIIASPISLWFAFVGCFSGDCYTEGCAGYTFGRIAWIISLITISLAWVALRWFKIVGGLVDRYEEASWENEADAIKQTEGLFAGMGWRESL